MDTAPTSTVFTLGNSDGAWNVIDSNAISEVAGYKVW